MSFRTARYASMKMPGGWRGQVFERAEKPLAGSRAAAMRLSPSAWAELWPTIIEQGFARGGEKVIKVSAGGQVARMRASFGAGSIDLICKQNRARGIAGRLSSALFVSRAWRNFVWGNRLLDAGVSTALPLLVMHRRRSGIWRESLLITEAVAGAVDLDRACQVELRRLRGPVLYRAKAELTRSLVHLLAGLQRLGLYHRDMKAPNVLVTGLADGEQPVRAVLVDLDGLRRRGRRAGKHTWQAVMRLNASLLDHRIITRTDRLRFLQLVLWTIGQPPAAAKGYWHMLEVWSARFLRKQRAGAKGKLSGYAR